MTEMTHSNTDQYQRPSPFVCTEPLNTAELTIMTLIHLDPTLADVKQRERLRLMATLFDPRFRKPVVSKALIHLRGHFEAKPQRLQTHAFDWPKPKEPPELHRAIQTLSQLSVMLNWTDWSKDLRNGRLIKALRLLGFDQSVLNEIIKSAAPSAPQPALA